MGQTAHIRPGGRGQSKAYGMPISKCGSRHKIRFFCPAASLSHANEEAGISPLAFSPTPNATTMSLTETKRTKRTYMEERDVSSLDDIAALYISTWSRFFEFF
jgi:hypothetical protein